MPRKAPDRYLPKVSRKRHCQKVGSFPVSVLMTFNLSGGILIPVLWSVFHDGDVLGVWQYLAIAVLLVSFVFLNWEKKPAGDDTRPPLRFYLYSTLLAVTNGAYEVLLNEQKKAVGGTEDAEMIVVTFAFSALRARMRETTSSRFPAAPPDDDAEAVFGKDRASGTACAEGDTVLTVCGAGRGDCGCA